MDDVTQQSDTEVLHAELVHSIRRSENTKRIYTDLNRRLEAVLDYGPDSQGVRVLATQQEQRIFVLAKSLAALWTSSEFKALSEDSQQVMHDALNDLDYLSGAAHAIRKAATSKEEK